MEDGNQVIMIELLFLDLESCDRCCETGDHLEEAVAQVRGELESQGKQVLVRHRHVTSVAQAEALGFEISPTVRVNGQDIQLDWQASPCQACTGLAGCADDVACRVWTWQGQDYSAAPVALLVTAIRDAATRSGELPVPARTSRPDESIRRFFGASAEAGAPVDD